MRGRWRSRGWERVGVEDGEQFVTSYGIIVNSLGQSQDNSGLESDTAQSATIQQTLRGDGNSPYLPHLGSTVAHLLIGQVGHLDAQLLDQLVVNVGGVWRWNVG